tara:strand:+ start:324 stop:545 length:222 start_codon:yes stop_codon:yes gene_type:complete
MKSILKFRLPEEKYEFQCAVMGATWKGVVVNLDEELRNELKHGEHDQAYNEALEYVRRVILNECLKKDLNLLD